MSRAIRSAAYTGDAIGQAVNVYATLSGVRNQKEQMELARNRDARDAAESALRNEQTRGAIDTNRATFERQQEAWGREDEGRRLLGEEAAALVGTQVNPLEVLDQRAIQMEGGGPAIATAPLTPDQLADAFSARMMLNLDKGESPQQFFTAAETVGKFSEWVGAQKFTKPTLFDRDSNADLEPVAQSLERMAAQRNEVNTYQALNVETGAMEARQGVVKRVKQWMYDPIKDTFALGFTVADPKTGKELLGADAKPIVVPATTGRSAKDDDTIAEVPRELIVLNAKNAVRRTAAGLQEMQRMDNLNRLKTVYLLQAKNGNQGAVEKLRTIKQAEDMVGSLTLAAQDETLAPSTRKAVQQAIVELRNGSDLKTAMEMGELVSSGLKAKEAEDKTIAAEKRAQADKLEQIEATGKASVSAARETAKLPATIRKEAFENLKAARDDREKAENTALKRFGDMLVKPSITDLATGKPRPMTEEEYVAKWTQKQEAEVQRTKAIYDALANGGGTPSKQGGKAGAPTASLDAIFKGTQAPAASGAPAPTAAIPEAVAPKAAPAPAPKPTQPPPGLAADPATWELSHQIGARVFVKTPNGPVALTPEQLAQWQQSSAGEEMFARPAPGSLAPPNTPTGQRARQTFVRTPPPLPR